jgi:hypothetical protein
MRPTKRTRSALTVLLSTLMAALMVTPAFAVSGGNLHRGRVFSNAASMPRADRITQLAPGSAGVHRPDGRVRQGSYGYAGVQTYAAQGPFVGNNIYNTSGAGQTATVKNYGPLAEVEGAYYTFDISIQNDGNRADRFKVKATGTGTRSWTVTYTHGATNITSAAVAGTYQTPSLAPGATYLIRARITINTGGNVARLVTIRSVVDPTKIDAVKFGYKEIPVSGVGA